MSETFSAGSAAFDVFKKRGQSGVLLRATLAYWGIGIILLVLIGVIAGAQIMNVARAYGGMFGSIPGMSAPANPGGVGPMDPGVPPQQGQPEMAPNAPPVDGQQAPTDQGGGGAADKPETGGVAPMSYILPTAQGGDPNMAPEYDPMAQQGGDPGMAPQGDPSVTPSPSPSPSPSYGGAYGPGGGPPAEAIGAIMQAYLAMIPIILIASIVGLLVGSAYESACLRWLVRGETTGGLFGLALNGDTWRVLFCYLMWIPVFIGLYLAVVIPMALCFGIGAAMMAQNNGAGGLLMLVGFVVMIAALCLFVFVGVRLAPASAVTIAAQRFAFFDSWRATKGRFWSLLGSFAILMVLFWVAAIVFSVVINVAIMGSVMGMAAQGGAADPSRVFATMFSPTNIAIMAIAYILFLVAATVWRLAMMGVNANLARVALAEGVISVSPNAPPPTATPPVGGPPIVEPG